MSDHERVRGRSVVLPTGTNYRATGICPFDKKKSGNGQPGICPFDNYRATGIAGIGDIVTFSGGFLQEVSHLWETGNGTFAHLINIGQRAERALAFLQTGGQKWASGMPVSNTNVNRCKQM